MSKTTKRMTGAELGDKLLKSVREMKEERLHARPVLPQMKSPQRA